MISAPSWIILTLCLAAPSLRCDETCDSTEDKAESAFELPVISANEFLNGDKSTREQIARKLRLISFCIYVEKDDFNTYSYDKKNINLLYIFMNL